MATTSKIKRIGGKAFWVISTEIYMNEKGSIQWMVHFKGGGWNSVWARTKSQALAEAKREYKGDKHCVVNLVSVMTPAKEESAIRAFY